MLSTEQLFHKKYLNAFLKNCLFRIKKTVTGINPILHGYTGYLTNALYAGAEGGGKKAPPSSS